MSTTRGIDVYLAIKEQATLSTPIDPATLGVGDYLGFESEGLSGRRQIVKARTLRRSSMQRRAATANGTIEAGGSLEFQATQIALDKLLPLATHIASGTTAGATNLASPAELTAFIHRKRYTLLDGGRLIPFSAFVGFTGGAAGEGNYTRRFKGCKVNSLSLSSKVNEFLNMSVDVAGLSKELLDGAQTPVYPSDEIEYGYLFDGASVKIKTGSMATLGELPIESVDIQIAHNLDTNAYRLGSIERYALDEGMTEVTGNFTMRAGADAVSGANLNSKSGLYNDRAFVERINLEGKYASLQLLFVDETRLIPEGKTIAGSTVTEIKLVDATKSVKAGDLVYVGGLRVRVASVDLAAKTITLTQPLSTAPAADVEVQIPSHLRIELPFVKLEEPDFNVKDGNTITGSAKFEGYDNLTLNHVFKLG